MVKVKKCAAEPRETGVSDKKKRACGEAGDKCYSQDGITDGSILTRRVRTAQDESIRTNRIATNRIATAN